MPRDGASISSFSSPKKPNPDFLKLPQFPTPHRGTGDALAGGFQRLCGSIAPLIATYSAAADSPNGPVYASAAIFVVAGLSMLALPIETRGRTTYALTSSLDSCMHVLI
jgi:hypothetical protein